MFDDEDDRPRGKGGRPRLDPTDRSVAVSLALPGRQFDRLCQRASLARVSVPEIIRRDLRRSRSADPPARPGASQSPPRETSPAKRPVGRWLPAPD